MRVLLINKFLYPKGGDAISMIATGQLLSYKGHEVYYWGMEHPENPEYSHKDLFISNIDYSKSIGIGQKIKQSLNIIYSFEARIKIGKLIKEIKPDLVHLNNFAHQISPSILDVIDKKNIPTVMTMHDYKMVCPAYTMIQDGHICDMCRNGRYYYCFLQKCTKGSRLKSLLNTVEMYTHHKLLNIYDKIDIYISPSQFLMNKTKEMGLKGNITFLPNFVSIEKFNSSYEWADEIIVYVGRLSREKGIETLIEAVKGEDIQLKIIGDGPIKRELLNKVNAENISNIHFLGFKTGDDLLHEIRNSMFAVIPSEWYENNPRAVIEAFALGKPVIGARIGGIPELVRDGETGLTFEAGNANDLRDKIKILLKNKKDIIKMGKNARAFVEKELNPQKHYNQLMNVYKSAMDNHCKRKKLN